MEKAITWLKSLNKEVGGMPLWHWFLIASIMLACLLGVLARSCEQKVTVKTKVKESVRVDTVMVSAPAPVKVITKVKRVIVPRESLVYLTDTIPDSVTVELATEQKTYKDSNYTAWVSGYRPNLDSIEVYNKVRTITVTNEVTRNKVRKFGVGLQGGYGYTPKGFQPYVGVGFSVNL